METPGTEQGSLAEGISQAVAETTGAEAGAQPGVEADASPAEKVLEALEPGPKWDRKYKDAFASLNDMENGRPIQEAMLGLYNDQYGETTRVQQALADLQRQLDPWNQAMAPYQQIITESGMTPQQAVMQSMGFVQALRRDFPGTIRQLASELGVDIAQLVENAPYTSPGENQMRQEVNQLRRMLQGFLTGQQESQANQVEQQISQFATAVDEGGAPLHPHFEQVRDTMIGLLKGGLANDLGSAYEKAVGMNADIQAALRKEKEQKDAAEKAARAEKEKDAARRPSGKPGGTDKPASFKQAIEAEVRKSA